MSLAQFFGAGGFDANTVEPQEDYAVLPPGDYPVVVEHVEVKRAKSNNGLYLEVRFQVLDGPAKGRKIWDRITMYNEGPKGPQAMEIGKRCLSALCRSINKPNVIEEAEMIGGICYAAVKVKGDNNEIRTYKTPEKAQADAAKATGGQPAVVHAPVQPSAPAPAPAPQAAAPQQPAPAPAAPVQPVAAVPQQPALQPVNAMTAAPVAAPAQPVVVQDPAVAGQVPGAVGQPLPWEGGAPPMQ